MKHSGVAILHKGNGLYLVYVNGNMLVKTQHLGRATIRARTRAKQLDVQVITVRERTPEQIKARKAFRNRGCH